MLGGTGLLLGGTGQYLVVLGHQWAIWGPQKEHSYLRLIGASFIKI